MYSKSNRSTFHTHKTSIISGPLLAVEFRNPLHEVRNPVIDDIDIVLNEVVILFEADLELLAERVWKNGMMRFEEQNEDEL